MKIGFTGTQKGMTIRQKLSLIYHLRQRDIAYVTEAHHGGCYGADAEFQELMTAIFGVEVIYIHQPDNMSKYDDPGNCFQVPKEQIYAPKPYLVRNRDIVESVDLMFAAPNTINEVLRSGTWATIRYAQKVNKDLIFLWP